jgi:hypothetical protein
MCGILAGRRTTRDRRTSRANIMKHKHHHHHHDTPACVDMTTLVPHSRPTVPPVERAPRPPRPPSHTSACGSGGCQSSPSCRGSADQAPGHQNTTRAHTTRLLQDHRPRPHTCGRTPRHWPRRKEAREAFSLYITATPDPPSTQRPHHGIDDARVHGGGGLEVQVGRPPLARLPLDREPRRVRRVLVHRLQHRLRHGVPGLVAPV